MRRVIRIESRGNAASVACRQLRPDANPSRHRARGGLFGRRQGPARSRHQSDLRGEVSRRRLSRGGMQRRPRRVVLPARLLRRGTARMREPRRGVQLAEAQPSAAPSRVARQRPRRCCRGKAGRRDQAEGGAHRNHRDAEVGPAPARPVGNFEPARVAPPPVAASAMPIRAGETASNVQDRKPEADRGGTGCEDRAGLRSDAAGPARDRSRTEPTSNRFTVPSARTSVRTRNRKLPSRQAPKSKPKTEPKSKIDDPAGVVSFLKKLVTPDSKPRKRSVEAQSRSAIANAAAAVELQRAALERFQRAAQDFAGRLRAVDRCARCGA